MSQMAEAPKGSLFGFTFELLRISGFGGLWLGDTQKGV